MADEETPGEFEGVDITHPHEITTTFTQTLYYPAHPPRKASGIYRAAHKELIYTQDLPCWICGVRASDFETDGKSEVTKNNPYGASQNETHHDIIEWAASNGIDWDKVAMDYPDLESLQHVARAWDLEKGKGHSISKPQEPSKDGKKIRHPSFKKLHYKEIDPTEFLDGVDQMKVLCDIHHRHPLFGIHEITGPIHKLQRYQKIGFDFIPIELE